MRSISYLSRHQVLHSTCYKKPLQQQHKQFRLHPAHQACIIMSSKDGCRTQSVAGSGSAGKSPGTMGGEHPIAGAFTRSGGKSKLDLVHATSCRDRQRLPPEASSKRSIKGRWPPSILPRELLPGHSSRPPSDGQSCMMLMDVSKCNCCVGSLAFDVLRCYRF